MRYAVRVVVGLAAAALLLSLVLPRLVGTTLPDVGQALRGVTPRMAALLTALWAAGLLSYSFVLTAALPGLSRRRALTMNLTGSAVANVLPFGGAAGMSLNYFMMRRWGMGTAQFAAYTLVSNLWGILLKLAMPSAALLVLVASGSHANPLLRTTALVASLALGVAVAILVVALARRPAAVRAAHAAARVGAVLGRRWGYTAPYLAEHLVSWRDHVTEVIGRRWPQLSVGMVCYAVLQAGLLWACTYAVGAPIALAVVLAGYAVDRVLTLAVVTPGAAGISEAGIAGTLVALGAPAAPAAAAVLLYRGFTFLLEIPVGGIWLAGWFLARRRGSRNAST